MSELINTANIHTINVLANYPEGKFRYIVKTKLGMTCIDARDWENKQIIQDPERAIRGYKKGALQTVQFQPHADGHWLTIFSRTGKKVNLIDETILRNLTVGTINSLYSNTNLYNAAQYRSVNSSTWASMAYVMNEDSQVPV